MAVSPAAKPEPVIVIDVPGVALARLIVMPAVTVKVKSEIVAAWVEEPEASMV